MRTLITRANGRVGCHVVHACHEAGHTPIAFVRPGSDRRRLAGPPIEVCEGDLLDAALIVHPSAEGTRIVLGAAVEAGLGKVVRCIAPVEVYRQFTPVNHLMMHTLQTGEIARAMVAARGRM